MGGGGGGSYSIRGSTDANLYAMDFVLMFCQVISNIHLTLSKIAGEIVRCLNVSITTVYYIVQ